ncbi:MAG: 50S ribosomal protein L18 [Patescibacteria group bacterium]|nr:50S ribosomal protein L18 [Patescibacteria group bacterium]
MMDKSSKKRLGRERRHRRVRAKVVGTAERPRLAVFRSAQHIYAQIINDGTGRTLAAAADNEVDKKALAKAAKGKDARGAKAAAAFAVGQLVAAKAKKAGVSQVVFDRGGRSYEGRVAALAEGAREGGLEF